MIKIDGAWVGINTMLPNILVYEAVVRSEIPGLEGYTKVMREVKFDDSRFDVYAENDAEKCFIEVKNVSYKRGKYALFPDAVSTRGKKHLKTLEKVKKAGMRAVMIYITQRIDVEVFAPAKEIDPAYAKALKKAVLAGVEIIPMQARPSEIGIELIRPLPFII
jgi:sugar fermentation stimulation protein A